MSFPIMEAIKHCLWKVYGKNEKRVGRSLQVI